MRRASCPHRKFRPRPRPELSGAFAGWTRRSPSTWSRFATPSHRPADRRLRAAFRPRPRTRAGCPPSRWTARTPKSLSVGNVDLARDGAGAVGYLPDGRRRPARARRAPLRRRVAARRARRLRRPARRPRSRSPPATATGSRSPGSPTASCTPRVSPGGDTPGGFAPAVAARRSRRQRPRHRPRRQRRRLRRLAGGRQRRRRAAAGRRRGRRVAAPLDIDVARARPGTGALRPRVAVSAEGYAVATWGERARRRIDARLRPAHHRPRTSSATRRT